MTSIVMEEYELLGDSKYRSYMSLVDKALKSFEYTTEWADLIAALGKLNKVLLSHMKYPIIPRRVVISKRLAQCMHPALPSGVHLKALDTYDIIFKCMGTNRLAQELFLYSAGLFPLLGHAAMHVRPALLTVYETHFVPLGERLRPALNGLLSGVLPGLEEGSDHYERTNQLLESVCEASQPPVFYGALWECISSNQSIRLPAITFVLQHLDQRKKASPKLNSKASLAGSSSEPARDKADDEGGGNNAGKGADAAPLQQAFLHFCTRDPDVMQHAICQAVQDSNVLVQRSTLDLLIAAFPLHETTALNLDMTCVVTASCSVLLRRDMSLNRRLFNWLLGTDISIKKSSLPPEARRHFRNASISSTASTDSAGSSVAAGAGAFTSYFDFYAKDVLIASLKQVLAQSLTHSSASATTSAALGGPDEGGRSAASTASADLRPYRLLITLLDKSEIGPQVVDAVIVDVFRALYHAYNAKPRSADAGDLFGRKSAASYKKKADAEQKGRQELIKSANLLFGTFDSSYIWSFCGQQFDAASRHKYRVNDTHLDVNRVGSEQTTIIEMCALIQFLLDVVSIETYVETHSQHLPELFQQIVGVLARTCDKLTPRELTRSLLLAKRILSKVQPAWNAWDAQEQMKGAHDDDEEDEDDDDEVDGVSGKRNTAEDQANQLWNDLGKEYMRGGEGDKQAKRGGGGGKAPPSTSSSSSSAAQSRTGSPEVGREATEFDAAPLATEESGQRVKRNATATRQRQRQESSASTTSSSRLLHQAHEALMLECAGSFQEFYVKLMRSKVFVDSFVPDQFIMKLVRRPHDTLEERTRYLECLLEEDRPSSAADGDADADGNDNSSSGVGQSIGSPKNSLGLSMPASAKFDEAEEESALNRLKRERLPLKDSLSELEEALTTSCHILVDLSSIPTVVKGGKTGLAAMTGTTAAGGMARSPKNSRGFYGCAPTQLPSWLQYLVLCSCLLDHNHAALQLNCVGTLLEIIGLLQSTLNVVSRTSAVRGAASPASAGSQQRAGGGSTDSAANIVIVMMPLIKEPHYQCILKQTIVTQVITAKLWDGLGSMQPVFHLRCVSLLHQLHNLVPNPRSVERILARSLGSGNSGGVGAAADGDPGGYSPSCLTSDVDAYQRFTLLWHLSRDLDPRHGIVGAGPGGSAAAKQSRTFDICLLKMLDNLNLSSGPLKALSQSWIVHAMARGDINRLMEPLFLTLLDPATARVSVLHAKIEYLDTIDAADNTSSGGSHPEDPDAGTHLIYAITTCNDEVIYHVSEKFRQSSDGANQADDNGSLSGLSGLASPSASVFRQRKMSMDTTDKAKRIFALARFQKSKKAAAAAAASSLFSQTASVKRSSICSELSTMPPLVNPFALVPPEVEEYDNFTRGYTEPFVNSSDGLSSCDDGSIPCSSSSPSPRAGFSANERGSGLDLRDALNLDGGRSGGSHLPELSPHLSIHPLHSHLLLYTQVCDSRQIIYTMQCIRNILLTNPRLSICTLSSTTLSGGGSGGSAAAARRSHQIQMLLARHRKSVFGQNFVGPLSAENMSTYRNSTLIEVLISTLLYYLRSYYPNLGQVRLSEEEIQSNREVQLMSIDIMTVLVSELVLVVQDNGRAYATYMSDLFARCKVQKVVLHSLLAGINDMKDSNSAEGRKKKGGNGGVGVGGRQSSFTDDILQFNEINSSGQQQQSYNSQKISNYSEAFQVQVLRLLLSLIMLEQSINQQRGGEGEKLKMDSSGRSTPINNEQQPHVLRYHSDHVIPDQPMFLAAIVSALKQEKMRHLHSHWTSLVTSCLPFLGKSLSQTVLEVSNQLLKNLEHLATFYSQEISVGVGDDDAPPRRPFGQLPADYVVTQLEAVTMIYHHCLLDNSAQVSTSFTQPGGEKQQQKQQQEKDSSPGSSSPSVEILSNLLHVFLSNTDTKQLAIKSLGVSTSTDSLAIARKILLSTLPRLVNTIAVLWGALNDVGGKSGKSAADASCVLVGSPRVVRGRLLDLASPLAHHHAVPFLAAVACTWQERRGLGGPAAGPTLMPSPKHSANANHSQLLQQQAVLPACNRQQQVLVELVRSIRTLPVSNVIQTLRQVLKAPPTVAGAKVNIEASALQFFYAYLSQCGGIVETWSSLSQLLKDCLALAPPAIFLALSTLNQFVHRSTTLGDRKDQKELQDVAGKLIEACAQIGGSCLEQTTWLRRNLEVNADLLQAEADAASMSSSSTEGADEDVADAGKKSVADASERKTTMAQYAVPALALLGELLAPLLDIIYHSEEKEKVIPLLHTVTHNVIPYLRNHSKTNLSSFRACSRLLASLSEYQYTRKAWKREGMELLLDASFFQMDLLSLDHWTTTVDNLMTHDKTTFKELMTKVSSINQSGSLSLFSSKDQELEQRALLLKRLAFVIYCSEVDQYQKQMPDIQERLAESLRTIPSSPGVQSAVFLCFRVILVRMSPHHVTSLWPLIITEMVQIFSYLEQELSTDSEEWSTHLKRLSTLDSSWVVSAGSNGLVVHNSPAWMGLYLAVCKLLDLALALPTQALPQFQMYRWAFVSESSDVSVSSNSSGGGTSSSETERATEATPAQAAAAATNGQTTTTTNIYPQQDFVPYVVRVARLLLQKMDDVDPACLVEGQPQLTMTSISSLEDLGPFFASICENVTRQQTTAKSRHRQQQQHGGASSSSSSRQNAVYSANDVIDAILARDFLEALDK